MKINTILLLAFFFTCSFFGQEQVFQTSKLSLKIGDYKKKYNKKKVRLTKKNHVIVDNDTLIFIDNDYKVRGVLVKYEEKDSTFLEIYKDIVYKKYSNPVKDQKQQKEYMKLWKVPIKIYFDDAFDKNLQKTIIDAANNLSSQIDSLKITFVKNIEESNYIIYEMLDENSTKYSFDIKNNQFIDYYMKWNKGKIYEAKLELNLQKYPTISKEITANYLLQNFYQTLGRFFTTEKVPCNSMFSICNRNNKVLSEYDLEIIKYHYSYGICKFTDLETFEENHKNAKKALKKGNLMEFLHQY